MKSFVPATTEPHGAPSPLLRHTLIESKPAASCFSVAPVAAAAFHSRAPSRWVCMPSACAASVTATSSPRSQTMPPPRLWVFSTATTRVGDEYGSTGLNAARTSVAVNVPPLPTTCVCRPASAASAPDSWRQQCAPAPMMTSSPCEVCERSAIWFAIVPVGVHSAASVPSSSATRACRRSTVGSSPNTSSPSSAFAIA